MLQNVPCTLGSRNKAAPCGTGQGRLPSFCSPYKTEPKAQPGNTLETQKEIGEEERWVTCSVECFRLENLLSLFLAPFKMLSRNAFQKKEVGKQVFKSNSSTTPPATTTMPPLSLVSIKMPGMSQSGLYSY